MSRLTRHQLCPRLTRHHPSVPDTIRPSTCHQRPWVLTWSSDHLSDNVSEQELTNSHILPHWKLEICLNNRLKLSQILCFKAKCQPGSFSIENIGQGYFLIESIARGHFLKKILATSQNLLLITRNCMILFRNMENVMRSEIN